jgi:hypothetical protein
MWPHLALKMLHTILGQCKKIQEIELAMRLRLFAQT